MLRQPRQDLPIPAAVLIRAAVDIDCSGILHCLAEAFEPYRRDYTAQAFSDTVLDQQTFQHRMPAMHILVAESQSRIVGTIAGAVARDEGHLRGMAVLPKWRGTGLASRLLIAIESWLKENGCSRVALDTTLPLTPAMRFYEKNGYVRSGKVSDFFGMPLVEFSKNL
jgi:GNAT superfamily N-acetyltransferase